MPQLNTEVKDKSQAEMDLAAENPSLNKLGLDNLQE